MAPTLVLNPAGRKMESLKVLNQPATPILIFFLTISLMFSVSGSVPYDYMQYVVQWQPAVCSNIKNYWKCKKSPKQNFTIHGLWPSNFSGAHVINCRQGRAFDINEVYGIRSELNGCWPNMLGRNDDFWKHEWNMHGIYSLTVFRDQLEYFDQAVRLCSVYNKWIQDILWRAQINRRNRWWVTSSYITNRIYNKIQSLPALRCYELYGFPEGPKQLQEVILCFDVRGEQLMDCPPHINNCPSDILFSL